MKRFLAVFLMLAILLTSVSLTAMAADPDGWKKVEGGWQYIQGGKPVADKWIHEGNDWYYISSDTYMATDWLVPTFDQYGEVNAYYYLQENGKMLANAWHEFKFVVEENGVAKTYSIWIYAKANGALARNEWMQLSGKWFYFEHIVMVAGTDMKIDGKWYYFKPTGEMVQGWYQPWKDEGALDWIYADQSGVLAVKWKMIDGKWYYFGSWEDWGLLYIDEVIGIWKDEKTLDIYAADKSGAMITNAWFDDTWQDADGEVHHDWFYLTGSGLAAKGWLNVGGKWYYMDPDWAVMWTGWASIKDVDYHFDEKTGAMTIGWFKFGDAWYYFKDSGAMARNEWLQINGKWYYFDNDGRMLAGGTFVFTDSKTYTFDANGVWVK